MSATLAFAEPALRTAPVRIADAAPARAGVPFSHAPRMRIDAVVETPLASLAHQGGRRFTAWRGRSGKRYIVSAFALADDTALGLSDAVLIAVSAERHIVAMREAGGFGAQLGLERWRDWAAIAGAVEIHVHLLAESDEARRDAMVDLTPLAGCLN
ncbi:MAG: hypothetical protein ACRCWO_10315 [Bosea sp. (in: a-proteobacteria)]